MESKEKLDAEPHKTRIGVGFRVEGETALQLLFFSILGNYSRLGLVRLTDYEGSYLQGPTVLWANLAACFMMGAAQALKPQGVFTPLFFTAVTTGYCGSVSSFSSFMVEMFEHATNTSANSGSHSFPNRAYGIMEFLSVLLVQLMVSMCSHIFGLCLVREFSGSLETAGGREMPNNARKIRKVLKLAENVARILAVPVLIVQIVLAAVYNNNSRYWTFAAVFSFPGTLLRYVLAKYLNPQVQHFPLGTFAANVFGTVLLAVFTLLARGKAADGSRLIKSTTTNDVLVALGNGFCGCLTTISTLVNEGHTLPLRKTLLYYFASIAVSFCLIVVILGSYAWTRGI
ncbi:LAQU0S17e02036g1_1 [Lachancea quebecensis]|uniref:LAQU0S17e02036g1_1 n=1 Tax=Lachancea quebecensis TaxID=1654605 RepID=A0A0P1KYP3_9SACH|nr:LAQU0S17e02036g1_1 [Lachancea quebecensis]